MKVLMASVFVTLLIITAGALVVQGNGEVELTPMEKLGKNLF